MFGKSLDLGVKNDVFGALMFFVTHLILVVGLSSVLVYALGHVGIVDGAVGSFFDGGSVHTLIGSLFVLWLGGSILMKRGLTNDIMSVIIIGVGIYLAYTSSVILGLIPIALLTTMNGK